MCHSVRPVAGVMPDSVFWKCLNHVFHNSKSVLIMFWSERGWVPLKNRTFENGRADEKKRKYVVGGKRNKSGNEEMKSREKENIHDVFRLRNVVIDFDNAGSWPLCHNLTY